MVLLLGFEVPLWALLSTTVIALLTLYVYMNPNPYKDSGLPSPRSLPFFGNALLYMGKSTVDLDRELREKYGKLVLTWDGSTPNLLVFDPDLVRTCLVKHFDKLSDRRPFVGGGSFDSGLLNVGGEHWKHVRSQLSPSFSTGKLKKMFPMIQNCCKTLKSVLKEKNGEPVVIRSVMSAYTLEVIGATAFGIDVDCQKNPDSEFLKHARAFVGQLEKQETIKDKLNNLLLLFAFFLTPKLLRVVFKYTNTSIFDRDATVYLDSLCEKMIADSQGESGGDFIKNVSNQIVDVSPNNPDTLYDKNGVAWSKKGLSKDDVMGNATLFLFAGYNTTADTSHFLFYEFAVNPEVQKKARAEVMEICDAEEISYEQVSKLEYVEWCINEALRLHPIGFRFDRMVNEDFEYEGITVKKGTVLTVSSVGIHYDPKYWEKPIEFIPERWSPENSEGRHPCAFLPFGYGPRQCIGMRLAMMEMKLAVAYIIKNFEIKPTPTTPTKRPLEMFRGFAVLPIKPIELSLVPLEAS